MNNILFFYMDDMPNSMWPYMPNAVSKIQKPGTHFDWSRTNYALCQPCRVSLYTGKNYNHHLVSGNGEQELIDRGYDGDNTVAKWLQDAGYRTGHFGKYLNVEHAFDEDGWTTWRQIVQSAGSADEAQDSWIYDAYDGTNLTTPGIHQMDYIEDNVLTFVGGSEPWAAFVCPTTPHVPFQPRPDKIFRFSDYYHPIIYETDCNDKPSWVKNAPNRPYTMIAEYQQCARQQLRELADADAMIGVVIDAIESDLDHTDIIFASDNGLYYGEHRNQALAIAKVDMYDVANRVPVYCKGPSFPRSHVVRDVPVNVAPDITATMCGIAGIIPPWTLDGLDLRDVAANPSAHTDRVQVLSRGGGGGGLVLGNYWGNGVVTRTHKLMRYEGVPGGDSSPDRWELYDLINDPNEWYNKAYAGEPYTTLRNQLNTKLDELLA